MRKIFIASTVLMLLHVRCADLIVGSPESDYNMEDCEAAWNAINNVYPLLEYKQIDWDSIHTVYRLRTGTAKGDEFYQVLFDLLRELRDPHVYLLNKGCGLIRPYPGPRYIRDRDAYSPLVVRKYFASTLQLACRDEVEYGIQHDNIGYIHIATFNDEGTLDDFGSVVDQLMDTRGLIIDVRQNTGGLMANIGKVLSRFIVSPLAYMPAFTKGGVPYNKDPIQPNATEPRYVNSVIVLISGTTISSGELFAELMGQLPTVTILGDTTVGGGCNDIAEDIEGDYVLPSRKYIHVGTTYACRFDGVPIDENGIPPDIRVAQTEADIRSSRDKQLEYAIGMLK
jgi:hypothetical protein